MSQYIGSLKCNHDPVQWGCKDCVTARGKLYDNKLTIFIQSIKESCIKLQKSVENEDSMPDNLSVDIFNELDVIEKAVKGIENET